ncbi:MAG: TIGR01459 family HAD-type hydrolase [Beijerinckiaceae bacterium]
MTDQTKIAQSTPAVKIITGIGALAPAYGVVLSDIWGVVHNGQRHFPEACAALKTFREGGGAVVLITNAPRPYPPVLKQLEGLGVPPGTFDAVVTSGDVTLSYIAAHDHAPVHHIGPPRDLALFEILTRETGKNPPRVPLEDAEYVVCTGLFDDDHTPEDYRTSLDIMLRRGMTMISANPDIVVHVGDKELYCSGAIAQVYEEMGGKVIQAGKPFEPIYDKALELAAQHGKGAVPLERVLAIGDGMRTDIAGAARRGIDSIFVTSGIHRAELHPPGPDGAPGGLKTDVLNEIAAASGLGPIAAMERLAW